VFVAGDVLVRGSDGGSNSIAELTAVYDRCDGAELGNRFGEQPTHSAGRNGARC
jgi:hypothetical protein